MPTPTATLGAGPYQPLLDDGSNPVGSVERLKAPDMDDVVLNRDECGSEQLGQDAAPRCGLERAQHQASAGLLSDAINHRLEVALLGPHGDRRLAGDQHPAAPK